VLAIDYSFARPTPAAIKAAGVSGVMRYLGGSRNKDLTAGRPRTCWPRGLWIGLNWESSAQRVNVGGMAGGLDDAHSANAQADQIGAPHDAVIFYSCDTNPNLGAARQYFQGVKSAGGRRIGWYGGMQVGLQLVRDGLVQYVWVANAASWSGFSHWNDMAPVVRSTPGVHLLQTLEHLNLPAHDVNEVLGDFPAWGRAAPAPQPPPPPATTRTMGDMADAVIHTDFPQLDAHGDGWFDVPGVDRSKVVAMYADTNDPPKAGYHFIRRSPWRPCRTSRTLSGSWSRKVRPTSTTACTWCSSDEARARSDAGEHCPAG
jgi:hypothetical protein